MSRRSLSASFAPGAYVFPGGTVDPADGSARARRLSARRANQTDDQLRFAVAAIREAWEELGILLVHPSTDPGSAAMAAAAIPRDVDAEAFLHAIEHAGLRLAADEVWWYCHWITDRDLPKRFDTRFLVARMPPGQVPAADNREQFEPVWIAPAVALARHDAGDFQMIFPTIRTLRRMASAGDVATLIAQCASERPLWVSSPRGGFSKGSVQRFSEDESAFGELELTSPDGQVVHTLDWQVTTPVRLLRHVTRLTAPNPGVMTGPGTNTYIVGLPETGYFVIDPGPAIDDHVDRIHAFVGDRLQRILCTHSHPDHSPGAARLKALTGAPVAGLSSRPTANEHSRFTPDAEIADGERFVLRVEVPDDDPGTLDRITLRAIHTPGHAANHVCFLLEEDRLLFSGDHVLNGSTTIVNPPDGDMVDYLASLERLAALDAAFIMPAHGHVLGSPGAAIAALRAHRFKREAKVLAAVQALPEAGLTELVRIAYDDTPVSAHGIAQRSLLAHLDKLVKEGRIAPAASGWRVA
jgi:recombination protein RecT